MKLSFFCCCFFVSYCRICWQWMKNSRKQEKLLMMKAMEKWCKMFSKFTIVKSRSLWVVKRGHASHIALIYSKQLFSQIIPCEQEVAGHRFGLYYSFRRLIPILLIMIKVRNSCLWNVTHAVNFLPNRGNRKLLQALNQIPSAVSSCTYNRTPLTCHILK